MAKSLVIGGGAGLIDAGAWPGGVGNGAVGVIHFLHLGEGGYRGDCFVERIVVVTDIIRRAEEGIAGALAIPEIHAGAAGSIRGSDGRSDRLHFQIVVLIISIHEFRPVELERAGIIDDRHEVPLAAAAAAGVEIEAGGVGDGRVADGSCQNAAGVK